MNSLLADYTLPEYAERDAAYKHCRDLYEVGVLRLVKTYLDFVTQRYTNKIAMRYTSFRPGKEKCLRDTRLFYDLKSTIDGLQNRDPAHFIAFVFEYWPNRKSYAGMVAKGIAEAPGMAYPSWKYIVQNSEDLLEKFNAQEEYAPRDFVPRDDVRVNYAKAVENRMRRWCQQFGKTPEEYWLTGEHLFPPFLSYREFQYAYEHEDGIRDHARAIKRKFDITVTELRRFLKSLELAQDEIHDLIFEEHTAKQKKGLPLEIDYACSLPLEAIVDAQTVARVQYALEEQKKGRDISTNEFEEEVDRAVADIDYDDPDTLLEYVYGFDEETK